MINQTIIFAIILILFASAIFANDACWFEYPGKDVIDLTTLGLDRRDGQPKYQDKLTSSPSEYSILILFVFPYKLDDIC